MVARAPVPERVEHPGEPVVREQKRIARALSGEDAVGLVEQDRRDIEVVAIVGDADFRGVRRRAALDGFALPEVADRLDAAPDRFLDAAIEIDALVGRQPRGLDGGATDLLGRDGPRSAGKECRKGETRPQEPNVERACHRCPLYPRRSRVVAVDSRPRFMRGSERRHARRGQG
ncbi:MAG: hypothetical protein F4143_03515 [Gemmatimonadales bacterium]|nr:hypothetical protein [Gemmatimonadales bacterium]